MSIRKSFVFTLMAGFVAVMSTASQPVVAASATCTGASCNAVVDLGFQVVIPEVIYMRIGDPGVNVNNLVFNVNAADVGNAMPQNGTGGTSGSMVEFQLVANGGTATSIQIDYIVTGGGSGIDCQSGNCTPTVHFIAWDQIGVSDSTATCGVTPPTQLDSNGGAVGTYPVTGGVLTENCEWTFTYDNTEVPVSGTYVGTVTYTANVSP